MADISATTYFSLNTYLGSDSSKRLYAQFTGLAAPNDQYIPVSAGATKVINLPFNSASGVNIPVAVSNDLNSGPVILSGQYIGQTQSSAFSMQIPAGGLAVIPAVAGASAISANAYGASALLHLISYAPLG